MEDGGRERKRWRKEAKGKNENKEKGFAQIKFVHFVNDKNEKTQRPKGFMKKHDALFFAGNGKKEWSQRAQGILLFMGDGERRCKVQENKT